MTITPEVAVVVLADLNKGNRTKKPEEIRRYAKDMADGRWALTGESIKFGTDSYKFRQSARRLAADLAVIDASNQCRKPAWWRVRPFYWGD